MNAHALLSDLHNSATFEEATEQGLAHLIDVAQAALSASQWASSGRLIRALLHLRPDGGYRGLLDYNAEARRLTPLKNVSELTPSTSAWAMVQSERSPVYVDVMLGSLVSTTGTQAILPPAQGQDPSQIASQVRLLNRGATHVLALPLRLPGGALAGMISVEAQCQVAMGTPFIWPHCHEPLQAIADMLAPFTCALPLRPLAAIRSTKLLPVVGAAMAGIVEMLEIFATQQETLLIAGATGTGKSKLARAIHQASPRKGGPMEIVDLLSLPEETQLPELFGWKRGAFTGSVSDHDGAVSRAEGGTLFIDEIDKLSLRAQAGLLTLLEERTYRPMGGSGRAKRADVRFVIGTNVDLHQAVEEGRFREDLYYRINILPLTLPSLAQRQDEIPAWAQLMLERRHKEGGIEGDISISSEAQLRLAAHPWPGNLRQLDNVIRRCYSFALMDGRTGGGGRTVNEHHVKRALGLERSAQAGGLGAALEGAARLYVQAMAEGQAGDLGLDDADAFKGFVLAAALNHYKSETEAFEALGKAKLVESRNHKRTLTREMQKVQALLSAVGEEPGPLITSVL